MAFVRSGRSLAVSFVVLLLLGTGLGLVLSAEFGTCAPKERIVYAPDAAPPPPPPPPCPEEMALITYVKGQICVDKYEAALDNWSPSHPVDALDASVLRAIPAKGIKPQVNISEYQAEAACKNADKRLCTGAEWTAACRGPKNYTYPYGNKYEKGACNEGRPSPMHTVFGPAGWGRQDDPRLAEAEHTIEIGGFFKQCVSVYGNYDMHGNVHEWVSDSKPFDSRFGVFVGGFFADGQENGFGCGYRTTAHIREYHDYSIGFRCCKEPRPALEIELR